MKRSHGLAVAAILVASMTVVSCRSSTKGASHPATTATTAETTTTTLTVKYATTSGPPPADAIEVAMAGVSFTPRSVSAKSGTVVFYLVNRDPSSDADQPHNMVVTTSASIDPIARSDLVEPGHSAVFTIEKLPAGTYPFHCSVDGHAMSGMTGTLTVTA
jgi:uncharacterized cupredoxin-like copper-binding protein